MITHRQRMDDPIDPWPSARRQGAGPGTLLLAAGLGVGLGLLAAPEPGRKTRKQLRKRLGELGGVALETLSERLSPGIEDLSKAGKKARKRVRKRVARLQEAAAEGRETLGERWKSAKDRWDSAKDDLEDDAEDAIGAALERGEEAVDDLTESDDDGGTGILGVALAVALGAGLTYLLTSDDAEPARARIREVADDVRRRAEDRWERYQQSSEPGGGGSGNSPRAETGARSISSDEAPQAS